MTTRKKSSSSSGRSTKKTTTKTNSRGRQSQKKVEEHENFTDEIILWGVIAISILLFISNFGIGGTIGNLVSSVFFGIFGLLAYVFPVILVITTFFFASNRGNRIATIKLTAMIVLTCFICMFIELILNGAAAPGPLATYEYCYANKIGGGIIGGLLAWLIAPNFGLAGAYVIDVVVLIICLVLITERSALRGVQKGSRKVYETAKVTNERHREMVEARREEQKLRRIDKKVEGVAIDTRILPLNEKPVSDEISELHIETHMDLPEIREENKVSLKAGVPAEAEVQTSELERILADSMRSMTPAQAAPVREFNTYSEPAEQAPVMAEEAPVRRRTRQSEAEIQSGISDIEKEIETKPEEVKKHIFPPVSLLKQIAAKKGDSRQHLQDTATKLQQTLKNFGVNVTITNVSCGPAVTRYELQPEMGVKVSKIVNLADDIKLNLAASDIRIEAPIPGKAAVGIEVPNKENVTVSFRELIESQEFKTSESRLAFCVGRDIGGKVVVTDIAKMPHLLIAGATGSGKSVCINTIIMSILYKADPKDVKLIMIDPKVVELSVYNGIPHLMIPVVTDPKKAAGALHWAVAEMTDRYQKFAEAGVRDLKGYNAKVESLKDVPGEDKPQKLPQIVIIVDELADLMMVASNDVEEAICRLAQLARACGIHLIIATQRPSVNVITGLIKANMPSRIAFAVTSGVDSRTILDMNGAEKLLGKGDMLFNPQGVPKPIRIQGAFVSDKEVLDVVSFLKEQNNGMVNYSAEIEAKMNSIETGNGAVAIDGRGDSMADGRDAYFAEAARLIIDKEKGSIGMLQRYFKVGFNRAARIMDQLEEAGIVGPEEGTKPRRVLMSPEQFEQFVEEEL
ncbi:MAG: DNA translocase FtsK 4TM domain-containing protein [Lachnospiraceae bacterium]|nr:DNA translocase FtsK 4TM domain-containing protein [Lachnospiraceae bacterium]